MKQNISVPAEPEFKLPDTAIMSSLRPTTAAELSRLLRKSNNKTCGRDPCPTRLLKDSQDSHLPTVLDIFNGSLRHGVFPSVFKQADVTPILKKPNLDEQLLGNYRPVSNLPYLSKLLERLVAERLCSHMEQHGLGERLQSAYKSHHSTETALMRVQNDIASALDSNRAMMLALIDLSAAFDTVDHTRLVTLLQVKYGIRGVALEWFRSYLTGRHFRVKVGDCLSDPHPLRCGVPQGSVLGPVIFNMYTAPLMNVVHRHGLSYHKYADDMQIYGVFDPASDADRLCCQQQLEECLADIWAWMLSYMLKINDNKTELMVFMNPQQAKRAQTELQTITLGGCTITATSTVRNLGVTMDSCLNGDAQVSAIVKACNYHLFQVARVRRYITTEACKLAVLALVITRLDYCNGLLSAATEKQLNALQSIQNRAARLVVRPQVPRGQVWHASQSLEQLH